MSEYSYKVIHSLFINTNDTVVTLGGNYILVLDDERDIVAAVARFLRKQGLNVREFTDPVAALEDFRQNYKDCVLALSDIRMPKMNGFQFVRMARELRPDLKVVFMTAFEIDISEFDKIHFHESLRLDQKARIDAKIRGCDQKLDDYGGKKK